MQEETPAEVFYTSPENSYAAPETQGLSEADVSKLAEDQSSDPTFFHPFENN